MKLVCLGGPHHGLVAEVSSDVGAYLAVRLPRVTVIASDTVDNVTRTERYDWPAWGDGLGFVVWRPSRISVTPPCDDAPTPLERSSNEG